MRRLLALAIVALVLLPAAGSPSPGTPSAMSIVATELGLSTSEFEYRESVQADAAALAEAINAHPDEYGGAYFGVDGGWYGLTIRYLPTSRRAGLPSTTAPVRWVPTTHSEKQLMDLSVAIYAGEKDRGTGLVFVSADITNDRIVVRAPRDDLAYLSDELTARYGVTVVAEYGEALTPETCTSRNNCPDWRGGISIGLVQNGNNIGACTWGFQGKMSNGTRQMITAGHCGYVGTVDTHLSSTIGTVQSNGLEYLANWYYYDVSRTAITGSGLTSPRNRIYFDTSAKSLPVISAPLTEGSFAIGNTVYRAGRSLDLSSPGTIATKGSFLSYGPGVGDYCSSCYRDVWVWTSTHTTLHSTGGDSGGPYFTVGWFNGTPVSASLAGFHTTHNNNTHYWTFSGHAYSRLGLASFCTTDAC